MVDDRLPPVKVSVIIPAYKAELTIAAALDSALAQAAGSMEVIVVDDASPDGTRACVDAWLREHPGGCRFITMPQNGGPAAARNRGAAEAHGEWLAFLDSDDLWLPWRLAIQLALAARHPDVDLWCGGTIDLDCALPERPPLDKVKLRPVPLDDFLMANPVATTTVLLRREAFRKAGGFDEQFRGPEDYDLWMRVAAAGRLAHLDCPLGRYRSESGSLSMDDRKFLPQVLRVLSKAFSDGGVLYASRHMKPAALFSQYNHASWMAFCRGARFTAMRFLLMSEWHALTARHKAGFEVADAFLPLFARYTFGFKPGRSTGPDNETQKHEITLRARWKRLKFCVYNFLSEPTVGICMRVDNEARVKPEHGDGWLHFHKEFTEPHRRVPFVQKKEFGVALLPVPEDIEKYLQSINGKNSAAYYARKAERRGYVVREIDRNQYIDEIHEIKISKPERQGRLIAREHLQKCMCYSTMPNYCYFGVLTADNKLVADAWVASYNEVVLIVGIMGHAEHLNNGVMYQLVIHIVKNAAAMKKNGSPVKYVMYDTFFGATSGMQMFKQKLGFKPFRVKWMMSGAAERGPGCGATGR